MALSQRMETLKAGQCRFPISSNMAHTALTWTHLISSQQDLKMSRRTCGNRLLSILASKPKPKDRDKGLWARQY